MNSRLKIFGLIALLGFVAGIIAQVTASVLIPWLIAIAPSLAGATTYLISGFAGACLTVAIVGAWGYLSGRKEPKL